MRIEDAGVWPTGLLTLMAVLPKPTGGDRLIGILPVVCRIWGRVRYHITTHWMDTHRHECFWACKGRSSSDAAFAHDLETELQTAVGGHTATVLFDLMKCYEMVHWGMLVNEAVNTGFSLKVLHVCLGIYMNPRVISGYASYNVPHIALQGIIAGCDHATALWRVLLYRSNIRVQAWQPTVTLRVYVDDTGAQWSDRCLAKASRLFHAAQDILAAFKELMLFAANHKSNLVCSGARVAKLLVKRFASIHVPYSRCVRHLGHDCKGKGSKRTMLGQRLKIGLARVAKVKRMVAVAGHRAARIISCGVSPSWLHTAGVSGVPDSVLRQIRTGVARAMGLKDHKSHTLFNMLLSDSRVDPMYAATLGIVQRYHTLVWRGGVSYARLNQHWRASSRHQSASSAGAHGPIKAVQASLARIGWTMPSPFEAIDHEGRRHLLTATSPRDLEWHIVKGIQAWQWSHVCQRLGMKNQIYWLHPIRTAVLSAPPTQQAQVRGARAAIVCGDVWTASKKHECGMVDSDKCMQCGAHDDQMHRWFCCPGTAGIDDHDPDSHEHVSMARRAIEARPTVQQRMLYNYGLVHPLPLQHC